MWTILVYHWIGNKSRTNPFAKKLKGPLFKIEIQAEDFEKFITLGIFIFFKSTSPIISNKFTTLIFFKLLRFHRQEQLKLIFLLLGWFKYESEFIFIILSNSFITKYYLCFNFLFSYQKKIRGTVFNLLLTKVFTALLFPSSYFKGPNLW